jgi:hypothetical protein
LEEIEKNAWKGYLECGYDETAPLVVKMMNGDALHIHDWIHRVVLNTSLTAALVEQHPHLGYDVLVTLLLEPIWLEA